MPELSQSTPNSTPASHKRSRKGGTGTGKGGRGSLTTSNLAEPNSPIHALASQFQGYLYLPDPMPLYVTMGMMAGNMLTGTPIWLMLVAASAAGKTALLRSICTLDGVVPVSSIKGEAALLSGVKKKEMAQDATGGLLRVLGDNGCLAFMDFTSVLSKSRDALNEILGVLRELFDQTWSRDIGGEGGRRLEHHGRVCLIAGVTHAIDRQTEVSKEMGERCLYFRFPETSGYQESMCAVQDTLPEQSKRDMQMLVEAMFMGLELSFAKPTMRRKLTNEEAHRIVTIAQFGTRCRSMVPRDSFRREVIDVSTPEVATRMSKELTQLYLGMEVIGNTEKERWAAMKKVAFDSMPLGRRLVLDVIIEKLGHARPMEIAREVKLSESAARRIIEDLELLGVVRKNGEQWELSEWGSEKLGQINRENVDQLELEL